ncbi:hypothetical protein [Candidatus Uabimicrobium amorphum]|uniref:Lipoprotein n=1 Tax=Uabimicrobium amorphum TaxID=2596890 RepID=A0A5S9F280_UABAM|nr:hypothetical protein [Candidatus Uabimicrobium amorphum]BBM82179.1 hypothetical protein UABAM_00522 [Candidatus Uabimicrobium amorphum]
MHKIEKVCLIAICSIILCSCTIFQERNVVKELGVELGDSEAQVDYKMGEPKSQFNFNTKDHRISVWNYSEEKLDYQPILEGDDNGVLPPPQTSIRSYNKQQCRLVFVDGFLCSIEDFVDNKVYRLDREELPDNVPAILDQIHGRPDESN